jgi:hypothetical protein
LKGVYRIHIAWHVDLHEHHGDGIDGTTELRWPARDVSTVELHGKPAQGQFKEGGVSGNNRGFNRKMQICLAPG